MGRPGHAPVLLPQVLAFLRPIPDGLYLDLTVGIGGHAEGILEASGPTGRLVGLDRDREVLLLARERLARFESRVRLVHADYRDLRAVAAAEGLEAWDGAILDLGVSSVQLDDPARGFAFSRPGPLDMRMDRAGGGATAADLLRDLPEAELSRILREYGEERWARRIARRIGAARAVAPLTRTDALAEVVAGAIPRRAWPRRIHPATRTFQALRIAVNRELEGLAEALGAAIHGLRPGGRVIVIAFHSLEDRIVKQVLRGSPEVTVLTKKPLTPGPEEVAANPRARSAKLRAARRVEG
ncbi:MAG: 16S rRNA (cytosine(1402)-N(4))-methyltransferase RsmH [candidate division NC10 bacterium]|nr:16S rRNA (cytosine(1402)-N(4))-methyltransferase RsmH [candidate division NC10 bacterium]